MREQALAMLGAWAARILPPLIVLALGLTIWEVLCSKAGSSLPAPSRIWSEAHDLITDPFFVAGPQDIGLGWRVLTSLQRVAIGYGLASIAGIAVRHAHRPIRVGHARPRSDFPGSPHGAAAGLAADFARGVPRCAAVRDLS